MLSTRFGPSDASLLWEILRLLRTFTFVWHFIKMCLMESSVPHVWYVEILLLPL